MIVWSWVLGRFRHSKPAAKSYKISWLWRSPMCFKICRFFGPFSDARLILGRVRHTRLQRTDLRSADVEISYDRQDLLIPWTISWWLFGLGPFQAHQASSWLWRSPMCFKISDGRLILGRVRHTRLQRTDLRSADAEILWSSRSVDTSDHSLMVVWSWATSGTPGQQLRHIRSADYEDFSWISRSVGSLDHSLMVVWSWAVSGTPGQQLSHIRSAEYKDFSWISRSVDSLDHSMMVGWSWAVSGNIRLAQRSKIGWYWDLLWSSKSVDTLDNPLMVVWSWAVSGTPGQQLSHTRSADYKDFSWISRSVDSLDHSMMVGWSWVVSGNSRPAA